MPVHNIQSDEAFQKTISENETVIVDFFATQDERCKLLAPVFVEQANRGDHGGVLFAKVDVDELAGLAARLGVTRTPTFLAYKGGEKVGESVEPGTQALLQFIGGVV
ncbi:hypothetical protein E4U42_007062 [Claviceps africana]|uniref:Thioredoxin domain-containing protein n=1 Tax=Claviceps africana TaxID=83212 RepID=A0A8K0J7D6_9HYPO|nr:hypothetical protein E4U42_007062 [Claviceps africana]